MEPLYYGHHWDHMKCPDYRGVLISEVVLYTSLCNRDNRQCPELRGVLISDLEILP